MFVERVDTKNLENRLDAGFYEPKYLAIRDKLIALDARRLRDIVSKISCGPFGGNAIADDLYEDDGLSFIRPVNISSNRFDSSSLVRVPEETLKDNGLKIYDGDNLYFGRVGVPCVALITGKTSISPNIIIAETKNKAADPYYLYCYISSIYGLSQLKRQLKEVAQPTTSTEAVKDLLVYEPNMMVQNYIGNKVRQAALLKEWADVLGRVPVFIDALVKGKVLKSVLEQLILAVGNCEELADELLIALLNGKNGDSEFSLSWGKLLALNSMGSVDSEREFHHINKVSVSDIEDFLTAQTYRPDVTSAYARVTSNHSYDFLDNICITPIRQGSTPTFSELGEKCIKSKQTRNLFLDETNFAFVDPTHPDNKSIVKLKNDDIIVTRQGAGTVGRATLFTESYTAYITDSLFLVRVNKLEADPAFIAAYLRSYTGQRLIEKGVYGSTGQLNLSSQTLRKLPIARVDLSLQEFLGRKVRLANKLMKLSNSLSLSAMFLIEALIEGKVSEFELSKIQTDLESVGTESEIEILGKITDKGFLAEKGLPLFSDFDALYELLNKASLLKLEED